MHFTSPPRQMPETHISPSGRAAPERPHFPTLLGPLAWARLHPDIRRRFGHEAQGHATSYAGRMSIDRSPTGFLFALAGLLLGRPLPLSRAQDCAAIVCVTPEPEGGIVWERWLSLSAAARPMTVTSVKKITAAGELSECVRPGPMGALSMILDVREEGGALVFISRYYVFTVLGRMVRLPAFLTPGRCRVAHEALEPHQFRFTLSVDHPVFGRTFHQTGVFDDPAA